MSFTLTNNSSLFNPVYNPFYFTVASSNTTQPNYKFLFDIYLESTGTTSLAQIKLYPRPGTNTCIFSPARVLESYLTYDLTQGVTGATGSTNVIEKFFINFGEEYGDPSTGTGTTYSTGITWASGYTWNSVLTYQEYPSFNYSTFILTGSTQRFLTNAPKTQLLRLTDEASLSYFNVLYQTSVNIIPEYLRVRTYQFTGGNKSNFIVNTGNTGTTINQTTDNLINHVGVGPVNFANTPVTLISGSTNTLFNSLTDSYYDVTWMYKDDNGALQPCSETITYQIDTGCPTKGYQPVRLMFLNRWGAFDYFNFTLVSRTNINLDRQQFKRPLAWNYVVGDRQNTIINTNVTKSISVTSDWVSQQTSNWLEELFESKEVYELQTDGSVWPVILDGNSFEIKKTVNDRLINYEFSYTYSFDINTQRG